MFQVIESLFTGGFMFWKYRHDKTKSMNFDYGQAVRHAASDAYYSRVKREIENQTLEEEYRKKFITDYAFKQEAVKEAEQTLSKITGFHGTLPLPAWITRLPFDNNVCLLIWMVNRGFSPCGITIANGMKPIGFSKEDCEAVLLWARDELRKTRPWLELYRNTEGVDGFYKYQYAWVPDSMIGGVVSKL